MTNESKTRDCPYCKEEIKVEAIKCKHCGARLAPAAPSHEGTCPYCKEKIHPDAIKCKHCQSMLVASMAETERCSEETPVGMALARRIDDDWFPDSDYRDCQNDCTLAFLDCMTTTTNRRSRRYCLERLRWCSLLCRAGGFGSFGGIGGVI